MLAFSDNLSQSLEALRQHKLRAVLTIIGLTMGVATLITVMTLVQGANVYVEQKIARLGTNVFQIAKTPFAATDFNVVIKALKYKNLIMDDVRAVEKAAGDCQYVGARHHRHRRVSIRQQGAERHHPHRPHRQHGRIDTRTVNRGRYFTEAENNRSSTCA